MRNHFWHSYYRIQQLEPSSNHQVNEIAKECELMDHASNISNDQNGYEDSA